MKANTNIKKKKHRSYRTYNLRGNNINSQRSLGRKSPSIS